MIGRLLFLSAFALICFANTAHAEGRYQLTKDGKVYVWNNYPRPGDEALWSGSNDAEGFAAGEGVLVWYKRGVFMSRYSGRMIKGKLDGPVINEDAGGKKFRGTVVNGIKSADWTQVFDVPPASIAEEPLEAFLKRKDAEITSAYQSCLASFKGNSKEQLRIAQRAWIEFSNKDEAAAGLAGSRRGLTRDELIREAVKEVEARTQELRSFFTLPNQDLASCRRDFETAERELSTVYDQVLATLASDEQASLQEAERAWRDFQQKSANSHLGDPSGRAPVWDRVVISRRRTEEIRDYYLGRLSDRGPLSVRSPTPSSDSKVTLEVSPAASQSAPPRELGITPPPEPAPSPDRHVHVKMISDFKEDAHALLANASAKTATFKKSTNLKDATPMPALISEAISKTAEKARELRATLGYSEVSQECAAEIAIVDALSSYDQALRAVAGGDGPSAAIALDSFLRDHNKSVATDLNPLREAIDSLRRLCNDSSKDAKRHIEQAESLASRGKTTEAIREYEIANLAFPDPKISNAIKRLREDSLGL